MLECDPRTSTDAGHVEATLSMPLCWFLTVSVSVVNVEDAYPVPRELSMGVRWGGCMRLEVFTAQQLGHWALLAHMGPMWPAERLPVVAIIHGEGERERERDRERERERRGDR
jgi:hypothetical protein